MKKWLTSLLMRIVGRIKKYMSAYYLTLGAVFTPVAVLVYLETQNIIISSIIFLAGMFFVFWGSREIRKEEKQDLDIQEYLNNEAERRHKELIGEIRKLKKG